MKALDLLIILRDDYIHGELDSDINDAIKEIEEMQQSNKDLLNTVIEAQKVIKNVLECKK